MRRVLAAYAAAQATLCLVLTLVIVPRILVYAALILLAAWATSRCAEVSGSLILGQVAISVGFYLAHDQVSARLLLGGLGFDTTDWGPPSWTAVFASAGAVGLGVLGVSYFDQPTRAGLVGSVHNSGGVDPARVMLLALLVPLAAFAAVRAVTGPYDFGVLKPYTQESTEPGADGEAYLDPGCEARRDQFASSLGKGPFTPEINAEVQACSDYVRSVS